MAFRLVEGRYFIQGYAPDGDSLRFLANNTGRWFQLPRRVDLNARDHAQLRIEAIDAPESHYRGTHQPQALAQDATDELLRFLGFRNVQWGAREVLSVHRDGIPGYIMTRDTDGIGRPVSILFTGNAPERDGSMVHVDVARYRRSANYHLANQGLVYPMYYRTFYYDLREATSAAVINAWNAGRGILRDYDWTGGVTVNSAADIEDRYLLYPKLFRRLTAYLATHNSVNGFKAWLEQRPERVFVLSRGQATDFDTVISQNGRRIAMDVEPEDLVFEP